MSASTFQSDVRITATFPLTSHETYAISPSGRTSTSCGAAGTSMVCATAKVFKFTTATLLDEGIATTSHFPSGVGAVPYPTPGSAIHRATVLVLVSTTARRG